MSTIRRCAIYTRKSSEEGLEQSFNSLHAQREACEAFIRSQTHEGWRGIPTQYDDGGFSGGTMERPGLRALMMDIGAGRVDAVVVYKVDRLTRSLADFAKIVELLDAKGVSFVSVTQQFNTTTSMGRLTLNVLLSFAQFEREVTGERIRDKIAASKAKGMWMGGTPPFGYDVRDRKLVVNGAEAETVRTIARRYLELGSVTALTQDLRKQGIVGKAWTSRRGNQRGGQPLGRGALYDLLQNRLYRGEIVHRGQVYPGQHDAILPEAVWVQVQTQLEQNRRNQSGRRAGVPVRSPLAGLLFDDRGHPMKPVFTTKKSGQRYRYYVSRAKQDPGLGPAGRLPRLPAEAVERIVGERVGALLPAGEASTPVWPKLRAAIWKVIAHPAALEITLRQDALVSDRTAVLLPSSGQPDAVTLRIPIAIGRAANGETLIHTPDTPGTAFPDRALIKALARGWRWRRMFEAGRVISFGQLARQEGIGERYVAKLVGLAFLAPDLMHAILQGQTPPGLDLAALMRLRIPLDWAEQRALFRTWRLPERRSKDRVASEVFA